MKKQKLLQKNNNQLNDDILDLNSSIRENKYFYSYHMKTTDLTILKG